MDETTSSLAWSPDSSPSTASVNQSGSANVSDGDSMRLDVSAHMRATLSQPTSIVALILGAIAITLNIIAAFAILKISGPLSSHYRFILSLALSDILIGFSVAMHVLNSAINPTYPPGGGGPERERFVSRCMFIGIKALNTTSLNITLLNLMGMAIDHFLAIVKPLHYPVLMHKRRASAIIAAFWLVAVLCGFSDFMSGYSKYPRFKHLYNYCEFVYLTKYQEEYPTFAIALMCAIVMITSYVIILRVIRRCHRGIGAGAGRQDNAVRNQKAVVTTLLILGTFLLCWLPMCLFQLALIIQVKIDPRPLQKWIPILSQADTYLYDLLMLNAICDPIIYAVRMREIRAGYQRLCPCCAPKSSLCTNTNGDTCHTTVPLELHGSRKINKLPQESFPMTEIPSVKKQVTISKSGYMKAVAV